MEWEERRGDETEVGEGACCEVTGEVPEEEESERGLSEARGTFLHICALRCFSTMLWSASLIRSHRLSNT